jgi:uncharacterized RDD family membrane protein YckC
MTTVLWHYVAAGQKQGPVSRDDIAARYSAGQISDSTLVWSAGMSQWRPLIEVYDLYAYLESLRLTPPPIPNAEFRQGTTHSHAGPEPEPTCQPKMQAPAAEWTEAVSPWRRWFARLADVTLFGTMLALVVPSRFWFDNELANSWVITVAWLPLEILFIGARGTTPGKALMNLRVSHFDAKSRLTLGQSAARAWGALVAGQGLGIPIVSLVTQINQYRRIADGRPVSYDENNSRVFGGPLGAGRALLAVAVAALVLFLIAIGQQAPS